MQSKPNSALDQRQPERLRTDTGLFADAMSCRRSNGHGDCTFQGLFLLSFSNAPRLMVSDRTEARLWTVCSDRVSYVLTANHYRRADLGVKGRREVCRTSAAVGHLHSFPPYSDTPSYHGSSKWTALPLATSNQVVR